MPMAFPCAILADVTSEIPLNTTVTSVINATITDITRAINSHVSSDTFAIAFMKLVASASADLFVVCVYLSSDFGAKADGIPLNTERADTIANNTPIDSAFLNSKSKPFVAT